MLDFSVWRAGEVSSVRAYKADCVYNFYFACSSETGVGAELIVCIFTFSSWATPSDTCTALNTFVIYFL